MVAFVRKVKDLVLNVTRTVFIVIKVVLSHLPWHIC